MCPLRGSLLLTRGPGVSMSVLRWGRLGRGRSSPCGTGARQWVRPGPYRGCKDHPQSDQITQTLTTSALRTTAVTRRSGSHEVTSCRVREQRKHRYRLDRLAHRGPGSPVDCARVAHGNNVRMFFVDVCVQHESSAVHCIVTFDNTPLVINQNQVRHLHLCNVNAHRIGPVQLGRSGSRTVRCPAKP